MSTPTPSPPPPCMPLKPEPLPLPPYLSYTLSLPHSPCGGKVVREAMKKKVKVEVTDGEGVEANGVGAGAAGGSEMDVVDGAVSVKKEVGDVGMVFTSTTEFTSRLEVGVRAGCFDWPLYFCQQW